MATGPRRPPAWRDRATARPRAAKGPRRAPGAAGPDDGRDRGRSNLASSTPDCRLLAHLISDTASGDSERRLTRKNRRREMKEK